MKQSLDRSDSKNGRLVGSSTVALPWGPMVDKCSSSCHGSRHTTDKKHHAPKGAFRYTMPHKSWTKMEPLRWFSTWTSGNFRFNILFVAILHFFFSDNIPQKKITTNFCPMEWVSRWWLNQPIWKIWSSKWESSSPIFGVNIPKKYLKKTTTYRSFRPKKTKNKKYLKPPPSAPSSEFSSKKTWVAQTFNACAKGNLLCPMARAKPQGRWWCWPAGTRGIP